MGHNTSRFLFTSGQLGTNFTIKMMKVNTFFCIRKNYTNLFVVFFPFIYFLTCFCLTQVQPSDEGIFVCTVEFDGGTKLTASTTLTVVSNNSSKHNHTTQPYKFNFLSHTQYKLCNSTLLSICNDF